MHLSGAARTFEALLRAVQGGDSKSCDTDAGGCGKLYPVLHGLERPPQVFTVSLAWDSAQAGEEEVAATLKARCAARLSHLSACGSLLSPAVTPSIIA